MVYKKRIALVHIPTVSWKPNVIKIYLIIFVLLWTNKVALAAVQILTVYAPIPFSSHSLSDGKFMKLNVLGPGRKLLHLGTQHLRNISKMQKGITVLIGERISGGNRSTRHFSTRTKQIQIPKQIQQLTVMAAGGSGVKQGWCEGGEGATSQPILGLGTLFF